jgi:hypothetical protein
MQGSPRGIKRLQEPGDGASHAEDGYPLLRLYPAGKRTKEQRGQPPYEQYGQGARPRGCVLAGLSRANPLARCHCNPSPLERGWHNTGHASTVNAKHTTSYRGPVASWLPVRLWLGYYWGWLCRPPPSRW